MSIMVSADSGKSYTPVPAGTHVARCYSVLDMGTHTMLWQGQQRTGRKVRLVWEIPEETIETEGGPKPMTIGKDYKMSLGERAPLRHHLEAWRGKAFTEEELKAFDISKLLTQPCLLTVIHRPKEGGGITVVVEGVSKLPKSMVAPPMVNAPVEYSVTQGRNATFLAFPEWLQKRIAECAEWKEPPKTEDATTAHEAPNADEDDIPF